MKYEQYHEQTGVSDPSPLVALSLVFTSISRTRGRPWDPKPSSATPWRPPTALLAATGRSMDRFLWFFDGPKRDRKNIDFSIRPKIQKIDDEIDPMRMTKWLVSKFDNFKRPPDRKCEICGAPSDFEGSQNRARNSTFYQKCLKQRSTPNYGDRPGADPAFHETIVITVPLGLTSFQNVILFDEFLIISCFSCFPLCPFL